MNVCKSKKEQIDEVDKEVVRRITRREKKVRWKI